MNSTVIINQAIAEGKAKIGICGLKSCDSVKQEQLLYRIKGGYICGDCLEKVEKILMLKGENK